ncbi:MAG: ABC transporter substrate-binding protein, partial [Candidatus Komeilibacteria bacterium]|nr:ABC transporter substrate-binding protein [Candidatus Komeilibacteria bacterium]
DDIVFTIVSLQDPNWQSPLRISFTNVRVEKIDNYTIRFILNEPLANFLHNLTVGIIPEHLWLSVPSANIGLAELNKKPIGSGPYRFASLTKDKSGNIRTIALTRFTDYFADAPYIDNVIFKFYGDYETGVQALKNSNVQGLNLLPAQYRSEVDNESGLDLHHLSLPQYTAVFFNTQKNDLLKDKALRQALSYAVDRRQVVNDAIGIDGQVINGPILPGFSGYTEDITQYNFDQAKANELLDATGWTKKEGSSYRTKGDAVLSLTLTTVENPEYMKAVEVIKTGWETVGVQTKLEIIPKDKIKTATIETRDYEALLFGQIIKSDPYPFWHSSQISSPGVNLSIWAHRGVDDLLTQIRVTTDETEREKKLVEFQKILTENAPAIFLYNPVHIYPQSDNIHSIERANITIPADRFNNITNWYIETKRKFTWKKNATTTEDIQTEQQVQ